MREIRWREGNSLKVSEIQLMLSVIRFASERSADAEGNSPMVSETVGQAMNWSIYLVHGLFFM